jgi:hypothetical protein
MLWRFGLDGTAGQVATGILGKGHLMSKSMRHAVILLVCLLGCSAVVAADAANPYVGRWALTIPGGGAGWLGVTQENGNLAGSILWGGGSVVPVNAVKVEGDRLVVTRVHVQRRGDEKLISTETITATVEGDALKLTTSTVRPDGSETRPAEFTGKRIPPLPARPDLAKVKFGKPITLFDGTSLSAWTLTNPRQANGWSIGEGGVLVNKPVQEEGKPHVSYGNLRTVAEFEDFNLKLDVNVAKGNNSGIYLRGIYEVQVSDSYGKNLDSHNMGGIYSRITPSVNAEKPAGEWQTFDITLVDRHVTVILNGKKIIDNAPLLGCTGGALTSDEFLPGPIYLQGDHTGVNYRNIVLTPVVGSSTKPTNRKTTVAIVGDQFHINGRPTYEGRTWRGHKIEGLLMNSRMVQGIFHDLNPDTIHLWEYPEGPWNPDRNTDEFVAAMPSWRRHGLLCAVVNLQGGSPTGYGNRGWHNSAIESDGSLRPDYMGRLGRILDRADELGMVIMVGIFYFGQDQRLEDENAVKQAVINTVDWIADRGYTNVLLEIANEHNAGAYQHGVIRDRPEELIVLARRRAAERGLHLPVSISLTGGRIPSQAVVDASDYILLHGNGVKDPQRMVGMVQKVRSMAGSTLKPIVNNEDDRPWTRRNLGPGEKPQGWDAEGTTNNFVACARNYTSWGYFDWRQDGEDLDEGFQSVPVNWQISSNRKRAFFNLLAEITGSRIE